MISGETAIDVAAKTRARPILFTAPMVRAIIAGRKTQTRRVVMPQPQHARDAAVVADGVCRWGQVGDRLWVRERWAYLQQQKNPAAAAEGEIVYAAGNDHDTTGRFTPAWRSSYQMPRSACRIELELTERRIEKLQQLRCDDAIAEGYDDAQAALFKDPRQWFAQLWDGLNPRDGCAWSDDPWVWVLTFRVIR